MQLLASVLNVYHGCPVRGLAISLGLQTFTHFNEFEK